MAKKTSWSVEQVILAAAVAIIVGGGAVAFYPTFIAAMDAWQEARRNSQSARPEGCAVSESGANAVAVFCGTNAGTKRHPTHSSVDTPMGAVRRLDTLLKP